MGETLEGLKVLLLDDDILTLELFQFVLISQKAEVKVLSTVAQAMEVIDSWHPDILISDINLPAEDGFSFIKKVREHSQAGSTPVIVITGYSSQADRERLLQAGCSKILIKPVHPHQLVSTIQEVLAG